MFQIGDRVRLTGTEQLGTVIGTVIAIGRKYITVRIDGRKYTPRIAPAMLEAL